MAEMPQPRPVDPENLDGERLHRKQRLAAAFHLFSKFGFDEGVAGHITARDPERPDHFWVNPFGLSFGHITVPDLILVNDHGEVVEGDRPLNRRPSPSTPRCTRPAPTSCRRPRPLALRQVVVVAGPAPRSDHPGCLRLLRGPRSLRRLHRRGARHQEGKRIAYALGGHKAVILRNHGLLTVGHRVEEAAWWFITMERSCQAQLLAEAAGTPIPISPDAAKVTHEQVGSHVGGWFSFQPLLAKLLKAEPDLFD